MQTEDDFPYTFINKFKKNIAPIIYNNYYLLQKMFLIWIFQQMINIKYEHLQYI